LCSGIDAVPVTTYSVRAVYITRSACPQEAKSSRLPG
jgi:hypothetical protein